MSCVCVSIWHLDFYLKCLPLEKMGTKWLSFKEVPSAYHLKESLKMRRKKRTAKKKRRRSNFLLDNYFWIGTWAILLKNVGGLSQRTCSGGHKLMPALMVCGLAQGSPPHGRECFPDHPSPSRLPAAFLGFTSVDLVLSTCCFKTPAVLFSLSLSVGCNIRQRADTHPLTKKQIQAYFLSVKERERCNIGLYIPIVVGWIMFTTKLIWWNPNSQCQRM